MGSPVLELGCMVQWFGVGVEGDTLVASGDMPLVKLAGM